MRKREKDLGKEVSAKLGLPRSHVSIQVRDEKKVEITEKQAQVVRNLLSTIQEADQQIGGSKEVGLNPHYAPRLECEWIDRMAKEWENIL